MEHKRQLTSTELFNWLTENGVASFKTRRALDLWTNNESIKFSAKIKNKKFFDTIDVVADLDRLGLLIKKIDKPSLEDLPMPEEGQSQEEYIASLGVNPSLSDANIFYTIFRGKLAQQKFLIEAEKLISKAEVENKAFSIARVVRDQMLAIPERVAGELSSMSDPAEIRELLYSSIINALSSISDDKPFS